MYINGTGESRGKPIHYDHLIYDKGDRNMQWRKTFSSVNGAGKTGQLYLNECNENTS